MHCSIQIFMRKKKWFLVQCFCRHWTFIATGNNESTLFILCGISWLPWSFYYLMHLRHLDLSSNLLEEISPDVSYLEKLTNLVLANNNLKQLPEVLLLS